MSVLEQSQDIIRCKLLIPKYYLEFLWYDLSPFSRIEVKIKRCQNNSGIAYEYFWTTYLEAFLYTIFIGIAVYLTTPDVIVLLTIIFLSLIVLFLILHVQTKAHAISIKKILKRI